MDRTSRIRRRATGDSSDAAHRIFAAALDALILIDPDGSVRAWSPGAERVFGRRSEDVLGGPAGGIAGGAWAERLPELMRALRAGAASRQEEIVGLRDDGAEIRVDLVLSGVRNDDGALGCIVGVARENGERRRLEETLRDREGRLVEVARMTTAGEILGGLAHEVNQPLTSIASYAGACLNLMRDLEGPDADRIRSHARHIVEQTAAAAEILRRARRFVRHSEEPVVFRMGELVREALALLRFEENRAGVAVSVEAEEDVAVMADRLQIEQAIVNLLRNAYESFAPESADRRVEVRVDSEGAEAAVSVRDNGVGIGEDEARLMDTFRSTKELGLGLGLGICRTIVERHHGRLTVARGDDGGTIARFTLPMHPARGGDA